MELSANRYTSIDHGSTVEKHAYDLNGNPTTVALGENVIRSMEFDWQDRLVQVVDTDTTTTLQYDCLGRRTVKTAIDDEDTTVTRYVYAGAQVIAEYDISGTPTLAATYIWGDGLDDLVAMRRGGEEYFFWKDDLNSIVAVLDEDGDIVERVEYDTFGRPYFINPADESTSYTTSLIGNPYAFTGREWDGETRLYYNRLRYYDPRQGRFINPDPIGAWGDLSSLGNPYTYAANNPWTYVDPFGLSSSANPALPGAWPVMPTFESDEWHDPYTYSTSCITGDCTSDPFSPKSRRLKVMQDKQHQQLMAIGADYAREYRNAQNRNLAYIHQRRFEEGSQTLRMIPTVNAVWTYVEVRNDWSKGNYGWAVVNVGMFGLTEIAPELSGLRGSRGLVRVSGLTETSVADVVRGAPKEALKHGGCDAFAKWADGRIPGKLGSTSGRPDLGPHNWWVLPDGTVLDPTIAAPGSSAHGSYGGRMTYSPEEHGLLLKEVFGNPPDWEVRIGSHSNEF